MPDDRNSDKPVDRGPWIRTYSGKRVYINGPDLWTINIEDIANHLSKLCRFTGACNRFYSVAEHSVLVSKELDSRYPMLGLLHDATEAYLGDVSSPLKSLLPAYKEIEDHMWSCIATALNVPDYVPPPVKEADTAVFLAECTALGIANDMIGRHANVEIRALPPKAAEYLFLSRYYELRAREQIYS